MRYPIFNKTEKYSGMRLESIGLILKGLDEAEFVVNVGEISLHNNVKAEIIAGI